MLPNTLQYIVKLQFEAYSSVGIEKIFTYYYTFNNRKEFIERKNQKFRNIYYELDKLLIGKTGYGNNWSIYKIKVI